MKNPFYYLVKDEKGKHQIIESAKAYSEMKEIYEDSLKGQWGRPDYVHIWKDFYNGDITRKELRKRLNL